MTLAHLYEDAHAQAAFLTGYDDALLEARIQAAWLALALAPPVRLSVQCAWCATVLRVGDPGAPTSHTICAPCADRLVADYARQQQQKGRAA